MLHCDILIAYKRPRPLASDVIADDVFVSRHWRAVAMADQPMGRTLPDLISVPKMIPGKFM